MLPTPVRLIPLRWIVAAALCLASPLAAQDAACRGVAHVALDSLLKLHVRGDSSASGVTEYQRRQVVRLDSLVRAVCGGSSVGDSVPPAEPGPPDDTTVTPAPPRDTLPPVTAPLATLRDSILRLMGPTISVVEATAKGGAYAQYESRFRFWVDSQWKMNGYDWGAANYYDRAAIYYTWWARGSGVASDTMRARQIAVDYRTKYLESITNPRQYASSPRWAQLEGLVIDWWVRGDSASRKAVLRTAEELWLSTQSVFQYIDGRGGRTAWEPRIQARILLAQWLSEQIDSSNAKWATRVDSLIPRILSTQSTDGAWRPASACGESLNYMSGMLLDVLARVHDGGHPSPVLATAITRGATWLWDHEWLPAQAVFRYMPINCAGVGGPNPAPDVAGLMAPVYGWLARRDPATWRARADLVLASTFKAYVYGSKQFNETFNGSYRVMAP